MLGNNLKQVEDVAKDCSFFQNLLHFNVPVSLANDMTDKLLISIDSIYKDVERWKKESWYNKIILELVTAAVHPSITKLHLCCPFSLISRSLCYRLNSLTKLRDLRLYHFGDESFEPLITQGLCNMEHLEVFTLHYNCSDRIITTIGNTCKNLKSLDVAFSRFVSDLSIAHILKLLYLKEINVMDTSISNDGYVKLFTGFKSNKVSDILWKLGCSKITSYHLNILLCDFSNLAEFSVKSFISSSAVVYGTYYPQVVRFFNCKFLNIDTLLMEMGNNLIELELDKIKDLNVKVIGENCCNLKKLKICGYVRHVPQHETNNAVLPGYQSLEEISLTLYRDYPFIAYLISECVSLKKVDLFITDGSEHETDMTMKFILSKNPLQNLQEFSVRTHMAGFLTKKTILLFINQCPNIKVLRGVNTWSSIGILEDFVEEMSCLYPEIHLSE